MAAEATGKVVAAGRAVQKAVNARVIYRLSTSPTKKIQ